MAQHDYWKQQAPGKALFPDIEWAKPELRAQRGNLGIIGGNKLGLRAVADAYQTALEVGAGNVRVLLPDSIKKAVPTTITDVLFAASNPSGSLSTDALNDMQALGDWSTCLLLIGDAGRNSETAVVYEQLVDAHKGQLVITRDAFDLLRLSSEKLVNRQGTTLVLSFAQLQKLFSALYYPIVLTFRMQLLQLVEALHKFTITYPSTNLVVFHQDTLVIAHDGSIVTMPWENPMAIWRGDTATKAATYLMWTPRQPLEAITTSLK
jgi:NAD(P)H-hydrate repair Nnr-like enzyme with NAD(P)H-hydrate dehydratase domain